MQRKTPARRKFHSTTALLSFSVVQTFEWVSFLLHSRWQTDQMKFLLWSVILTLFLHQQAVCGDPVQGMGIERHFLGEITCALGGWPLSPWIWTLAKHLNKIVTVLHPQTGSSGTLLTLGLESHTEGLPWSLKACHLRKLSPFETLLINSSTKNPSLHMGPEKHLLSQHPGSSNVSRENTLVSLVWFCKTEMPLDQSNMGQEMGSLSVVVRRSLTFFWGV